MRKKPVKPKRPAPAAKVIPGGLMKRPAPAHHHHHHHHPAPKVIPGGLMKRPAPAKKPAAKKKRKLAGPGENCVTDACYALTGHWLDPPGDGLFIPAALETLAILGLISGYAPADLDDPAPWLILGTALPGPHAVVTVPGGWWWSWGELYDPGDFPGAVIEEAWKVTV